MTNVRLQLEKREESLSFYATKSKNSKRDKSETPCPFRTEFQRDRDRILYSKAFRRLKHKTQVFIAPTGDHYATRLTHTLKVAQIARTIARALNLNEDLVEAMSLGHDIGHTPFGHTGEDVLDKLYPDGFLHNLQSIRIVEILENDGAGLNLTQEVKDGILKHSVSREKITGMPNSLEGEICKIADKIAYITHDIDDAFRAGLIKEADLPKSSVQLLGSSYSERVNSFVVNVIQESQKSINKILDGISAPDNKKATISLTPAFLQEMKTLKFFLYERTYSSIASTEREKARTIIYSLYEYFSKNPSKIPEKFIKIAKNEKERAIVDYIAGMTDNYALNKYNEIKKTFSHS